MTRKTKDHTTDPESLPTPASGQLQSALANAPLPTPDEATAAGLGAESAGQSGDSSGLAHEELADSESVEALSEEGQDYEAELVAGVEDAPDADQGGVRTHRYVTPETLWKDEG